MNETVKLLRTDSQNVVLPQMEQSAANISGMIFQFLQRQDGSLSILYISSKFRELYELEPEVMQRDVREILNLIHPQDLKSFEESVATSYLSLSSWRWSGRIITQGGTLKWIQSNCSPEPQANGDILWDGFVIDITEWKLAEKKLRESAHKYKTAFRCSPNPITISTLKEGRIIEVNDAFIRLSGYEFEEVIGRTTLDLNIWVRERDRLKLLQQLREFGSVHNLEFEFRHKSGEVRFALCSAQIIHLDGVACLLAVNHDITEPKQTEELLRKSALRDRLLAQTLTRIRSSLNLDQILQNTVNEVRQFLQADRVFIAMNDGLVKSRIVAESADSHYPSVLGWIPDNDLLDEWRTQLATHRVRIDEDVTKIVVSPKLSALYQKFQTRASLAVPIIVGEKLFGALIANQCNSPRHWTSIEIDLLVQMSEQVAIAIQQAQLYEELAQLNSSLERQVEERTAQLQQKMQEIQEISQVKDVVLHTVTHDLRTSVMGNLMVLNHLLNQKEGGDCNLASCIPSALLSSFSPHSSSLIPVPHSIIERMIQGNARQLAMIDSLLEIHSSKEQGIVLNRHAINFSTLLETTIKDLSQLFKQHQATVNNLIPLDLPSVLADPIQLQKVLLNWFTHSWQTNPPGLNFTLKAIAQKGMIRCIIQDDGVGMSKLECDRMFDLYVREPQATCSTDIGLKMFLSRQIIKAHGGEIGVNTSKKRGLTFWFTLPILTPSE